MFEFIFDKYEYDIVMEIIITIMGDVFLLIMIFSLAVSMIQDKNHKYHKNISIPYTSAILQFYVLIFFYNLFNVLLFVFDGESGQTNYIILQICAFIFYIFAGGLTLLFLSFFKKNVVIEYGGRIFKNLATLLQCGQIVLYVVLIITPFTGFIYYYDESNVYQRGIGAWIWQGFTIVSFLFIGILIIYYYRRMNDFLRDIGLITFVLPVTALIMSLVLPNKNYTTVIVTIAAMFVYMLYENHRALYSIEYVLELEEVQKKLMLDQIQPHFLHNSLTSIIYYIDKDPEKAKGALTNFSRYLRSNLDSVNEKSVIPFKQELEHTKMYLSLEKLRFEDKLEIEYDIQDLDFEIPVLTLQPMVENAVKHGLRKSESGGGTVRIETKETGIYHIIKVIDDGAGFNTTMMSQMDDKHIGIRNVMKRLQIECGGHLEIESKVDEGTTCIIMIPKK